MIFFGMVLTIIGVHVTKELVDRPRPADPLTRAAGQSYPSGHTAYAMVYIAIAVALSALYAVRVSDEGDIWMITPAGGDSR